MRAILNTGVGEPLTLEVEGYRYTNGFCSWDPLRGTLAFPETGYAIQLGHRTCLKCRQPIVVGAVGMGVHLTCRCTNWAGGSENYGGFGGPLENKGKRSIQSVVYQSMRLSAENLANAAERDELVRQLQKLEFKK